MYALFGAVYGLQVTNLHTAAYETLKSVGLQLVSNPDLRLGIARVFDHYYQRLHEEHQIELLVTFEVLRPYYLEHFRELRFYESATPIDYDAVISDSYSHNSIDYRLAVVRSNQLDSYALAAEVIHEVLELLDAELAI